MNRKTLAGDRRRRKLITVGWALGLALVVIVLIYFEKSAILYILCTLGVTVLLGIVAMADLRPHDLTSEQMGQTSDAAGVAGRRK